MPAARKSDRRGGFGFQPERLVQGAHGKFHVLVADQDRGLDFARADHLDIDALFRERAEHQAGNAGVRPRRRAVPQPTGDLLQGYSLRLGHHRQHADELQHHHTAEKGKHRDRRAAIESGILCGETIL